MFGALKISFALLVAAAGPCFAQELKFERAKYPKNTMAEIELGRLLFYDPILSGNKSVSCSTCHHPKFATSDGLALGLGDGGIGLGLERTTDPDNLPEQRVPRNSPALFNLGAAQFISMFHDGRLEADTSRASGLRTPLEDEMVAGFDSVLSAQAMFPVLSPDEMAGHYLENDVARAVRIGLLTGEGGAWQIIAQRIRDIDEYDQRFAQILPEGKEPDFADIANVLAAFIAFEWRADDSPFDRYVFEAAPLPEEAAKGMTLFYGKANCSSCHSGLFQTDHQFHAIAMPQLGPGKAARFEDHVRDTGRMHVTGNPEDAYQFRTPSLRNVAHTAPYGHSGAFATMEEVVRHHLEPIESLKRFQWTVELPKLAGANDLAAMQDPEEIARIADANDLEPIDLSDVEIAQLIAFLNTLTDEVSIAGRLGSPLAVPSGLPLDQ